MIAIDRASAVLAGFAIQSTMAAVLAAASPVTADEAKHETCFAVAQAGLNDGAACVSPEPPGDRMESLQSRSFPGGRIGSGRVPYDLESRLGETRQPGSQGYRT